MSYSELQAGAGSRRSAQVMVIPLASAATPGQCLPEAPNLLIINDRPSRAGPRTALAKLAVGVLQRRFAALPRTSTRRLNTIYIVAGLIILAILLLPVSTVAAVQDYSITLGNGDEIPIARYPADGQTLLLWLPSEFGLSPRQAPTAHGSYQPAVTV